MSARASLGSGQYRLKLRASALYLLGHKKAAAHLTFGHLGLGCQWASSSSLIGLLAGGFSSCHMGIVIGLLMTKLLASPRASGEKEKERERVSAFPFAASPLPLILLDVSTLPSTWENVQDRCMSEFFPRGKHSSFLICSFHYTLTK